MSSDRAGSLAWRDTRVRAVVTGVVALMTVGLLPAHVATAQSPWVRERMTAHADDGWAAGRQFGLSEPSTRTGDGAAAGPTLVASAAPGSVLLAQAGGGGAEAPAEGWRFSIAPYLWMARTEMTLDVGQFSRTTTIKFTDVVPQLHFAFAAHAEATWREWTGFLDLLYMSMGQSETLNRISVSTNLQQMFFEFGATYRLPSLSLGRAGRLTFEPLAGGRFIWVDASLGFPNQKVSQSASLIDPMFGGRIAYHITDKVALWFRGDAAGFGISDNQTKLTYNLLGGVEWRFSHRASALAGWRYMNIDLETASGAGTLNADISMNGPFLAINFQF